MCFYIDNNNKSCKTAKEDILCYKTVNEDYESSVMGSSYRRFGLYYAKSDNKILKSLKVVPRPSLLFYDSTRYIINEGIHSYSDVHNVSSNTKRIIYCIIPKGTKYYRDDYSKEYVSLQIRRIGYKRFEKLLKKQKV